MTIMTTLTASAGTDTEYCDCPRSGDLWRCENPGATCRQDGRGCALTATFKVSGLDTWNGVVENELKRTPCPCGRPRNQRA